MINPPKFSVNFGWHLYAFFAIILEYGKTERDQKNG